MGIGLFGKYPLKRDFIAFNLPRAVLDPIDRWLQSGIAASREARSNVWKEMFLVQPIWNFRLGRQITGTDCIGAMMPSVDGVGRYFPLALVAYAPEGQGFPIWSALDIDDWLKQVRQRLLSALADGDLPTPDELVRDMELPPTQPVSSRQPGRPVAFSIGSDRASLRETVERSDLALAADMQSVWWTEGGAYVGPELLTCQGMPNADMFTHMMGRLPSEQPDRGGADDHTETRSAQA